MTIPFFGKVELGISYPLFVIPLIVASASNLTNIFAGFNGMEAGMGAVMFASLFIISSFLGLKLSYWISLIMLSALVGFFLHNKYPAKVFPGDSLTLLIGAVLSSLAIMENFESLLPFFLFPHALDAVFKILAGIPTTGWWGVPKNGRLYFSGKPKGLAQATISLFKDGIKERDLVLLFILLEVLSSALGILYAFFFLYRP